MAESVLDRIHLELTNRCNFRCEFCPQSASKRVPVDMDFDLFRRLVDEISERHLSPTVSYHLLGEPLLYRKLPEAIAYTREAGLRPVLVTNGSLFSEDYTRRVAIAGPHQVGISLQTPDNMSFALRGAGDLEYGQYRRRVLGAVGELLSGQWNTRVSIYLLTTPLKWLLFPATRGLTIIDTNRILKRQVTSWARVLSNTLGNDHPLHAAAVVDADIDRLRVWRQNRVDLSSRLSIETRIVGDWGRRARQTEEHKARYPAHFGSCHGLSEHLAVLADGTYAYCCTDYDGATSRRNAAEVGIEDFLTSPEVTRDLEGFRRWRVENPACRTCLGGPTRLHRAVRQWGSILYQRVYRKWFQDPIAYRDE